MSEETHEEYLTKMFLKNHEWSYWFYSLSKEQWKMFYEWLETDIKEWEKENWP